MSTVIMARTATDAREVAVAARLKQWIYPTTPAHLMGVKVERIVFVEGWLESTSQSTAVGIMLASRADEPDEHQVDVPSQRKQAALDAGIATIRLQLERDRKAGKLAVTPEPTTVVVRSTPWWRRWLR